MSYQLIYTYLHEIVPIYQERDKRLADLLQDILTSITIGRN